MKKIMIVGAGKIQTPIIRYCKSEGYKVIATDIDQHAEGLKYADVAVVIDTLDRQETLYAAMKYDIDAILTMSDYPVRTVAYVCEKLGFPGLTTRAAEISTNKYLFRECLRKNQIRVPFYRSSFSYAEIKNMIKTSDFPLVVKPVDSSASRGVSKVENFSSLKSAFEEAQFNSKNGQVIVEEYLEGPEYSVESLTQNSKNYIVAITEKTTSSGPFFVEERHIVPAKLTTRQRVEIENIVAKIIKAVGINNSASHAEIKLTCQGPVAIEIGARLGGDYITSDLVPLAKGVNMFANIVDISLNKKIEVTNKNKRYSGIQFITPNNYKAILSKWEIIKEMDNCVRWDFYSGFSEKCIYKSSLDRLGYFICVANTRQKLIESLDIYKNSFKK